MHLPNKYAAPEGDIAIILLHGGSKRKREREREEREKREGEGTEREGEKENHAFTDVPRVMDHAYARYPLNRMRASSQCSPVLHAD